MDYLVIYEKTSTGYGAHVPDLPGCIAGGKTLETAKRRMLEAVEAHLQGMLEDGIQIPEPTTLAETVNV